MKRTVREILAECKGGREVMSLRDFTLCIKTIHAHLNLACFSPDGSRECKGTEVRKIVNELRSNGVPICSLPIGYYYAETKSEIKDTLAHLESRIKKIEKAKEGMEETLKTYDE